MSFRLDKIYTRSGDKGKTHLIGGKQVAKSDLQVECYGTADELNSFVGMLRTELQDYKNKTTSFFEDVNSDLKTIQNDLFDIGSILATAIQDSQEQEGKAIKNLIKSLSKENDNEKTKVAYLENRIDAMNLSLEPIRSFTLPGGGKLNAWAHLCRTVCRRFERLLVAWGKSEELDPMIIAYVNRLSDYFFVLSRFTSKTLGEDEFLWETPLK